MNFSSCRNYYHYIYIFFLGGGGQNDMFATPIYLMGGGCPPAPPPPGLTPLLYSRILFELQSSVIPQVSHPWFHTDTGYIIAQKPDVQIIQQFHCDIFIINWSSCGLPALDLISFWQLWSVVIGDDCLWPLATPVQCRPCCYSHPLLPSSHFCKILLKISNR